MTTEFMQPNNPIRVWQSGQTANFCHQVFAIAISNCNDIDYLTVNGMFIPKAGVMYAEVFIENKWQAIHVTDKATVLLK